MKSYIPEEWTSANSVGVLKYAWSKVIAAAWNDSDLERRLLEAGPDEVRRIFKEVAGVDPGEKALDLRNMRVKKFAGDGFNSEDKSWTISAPEITLPYPPKPMTQDAAIALAQYDFQGAASPFTCCC